MEKKYLFLETGRGCLLALILLPPGCAAALWVYRSCEGEVAGALLGSAVLVPFLALVLHLDRRRARPDADGRQREDA